MTKKLAKLIFPLCCVLLLAPWPVAYAHDTVNAAEPPVQVTVAEAVPSITAFGKAIGSVKPGDLFYIDASNSPADIEVSLYLTNASELAHHYRYMILKVGVYVQSGSNGWEKAGLPDTYLTMRNGGVNFRLQGYAQYRITVEGGSFYCFGTNKTEGDISPRFYLEVSQ